MNGFVYIYLLLSNSCLCGGTHSIPYIRSGKPGAVTFTLYPLA